MINNPNSSTQNIPNADFPPPPPSNPRRNLWVWILAIVAVVLIAGTIAVFAFLRPGTSSSSQTSATATATTGGTTPTTTSDTPTATSSSTGGTTGGSGGTTGGAAITVSQATATVSTYYADINARAYSQAYNIWGSAYRKTTSSYQFYVGYADTQSDKLQLGTATQLSDGTVKVPVTVTATVSSSGGPAVNTYQGYYIVGLEGGQPRLLNANLQLTSSSNNSVKQAVSLLEQYYADIKTGAYSAAYDIWGSAYHKTTSSYQFVHGFDNTKSTSVSINSEGVTLLNDGTVKVPVTITSVTNNGSGNVTHTYTGYYIIGIENGAWHLLSADIH